MHSIYLNNQETLDEIQVAIYTQPFDLIYHDANEIDLIKETPELIQEIRRAKEYFFYQDRNQAVGLAYQNGEKEYVITAINVDRYGYAKMICIRNLLIIMFVVAILILLAIGYALARAALRPFSDMIHKVETSNVRIDEVLLDAREWATRTNDAYCIDMLFECESEDESSMTVVGNEYLLRTAFINLMENNCKFSENKTSIVRISYFEQKTIIRFSDTGVGISQADIEQLFIPFYRGQNRHYAPGNGIGMALAQKIIAIHSGTIRINSHVGEGTVFTVEIPHI